MSRSHLVRALVLGTTLILAAQSASAEPRRSREVSGWASDLFTQLWHVVTTSLPDSGCWLDPGGCGTPREQTPPPETEVGRWLESHGGGGAAQEQAPPPDAEIGCWIDPYGNCRAGG
jgi:hypothetical protein